MRSIEWSSLARDDLAAIDAYWWSNNPARADEILDRIEAGARFLLGVPRSGPSLEDSPVRKWNVQGTHYRLIYRVRQDCIEVLRVHHERQDWPDFE